MSSLPEGDGRSRRHGRSGIDLSALVVALAYAAPVHFTAYDVQTFAALWPAETYPRALIEPMVFRALEGIYIVIWGSSLLVRWRAFPLFLLGFLLLAGISAFWSVDARQTIATTFDLALLVATIAVAIRSLGSATTIRLAWWFGSLVTLASVILALVGAREALMTGIHDGAWRGLFAHKNVLGLFAAATLLLTLFARPILNVPRLVTWLICGVAVLAIFRSGSATAVVAVMFAVLVGLFNLALVPFRNRRLVPLTIVALVLPSLLLVLYEVLPALTELLGRDLTLTGRTSLWSAVLPMANQAPLGYGFGTSGGDVAQVLMRQSSGWAGARTTHNAYLALALDLGWGAAMAYVAWMCSKLIVLKAYERPGYAIAATTSVLAAFHLASGLAESVAGPYASFPFAVLLLLVMSLRDESALRYTGFPGSRPVLETHDMMGNRQTRT